MRVKITLNGPGGELDSRVVTLGKQDYEQELTAEVEEFIESHVWDVGDSLTVDLAE